MKKLNQKGTVEERTREFLYHVKYMIERSMKLTTTDVCKEFYVDKDKFKNAMDFGYFIKNNKRSYEWKLPITDENFTKYMEYNRKLKKERNNYNLKKKKENRNIQLPLFEPCNNEINVKIERITIERKQLEEIMKMASIAIDSLWHFYSMIDNLLNDYGSKNCEINRPNNTTNESKS